MTTLLVGFDSAWTSANSGGLVGALQLDNGSFRELTPPQAVTYCQAEGVVLSWKGDHRPRTTIVLIDQPTIVRNPGGQRPVEHLVGSVVGRRYGGMQPANTAKERMFGDEAPIWRFLTRFGGPADPMSPVAETRIIETYPALAMVALRWTLPDRRAGGRLPKYNPTRRTFSKADWSHVCARASRGFFERGLIRIGEWLDEAAGRAAPRKSDQDGVDACVCLLVALYLAEQKDCLMVGDLESGYIVVPYCSELHVELENRCIESGRTPSEWVRVFRLFPAL